VRGTTYSGPCQTCQNGSHNRGDNPLSSIPSRSPTIASFTFALFLAGTAAFSQERSVDRSESSRYDIDYPVVAYGARPRQNEVARLQERIDRGEVRLAFRPGRGYLDALLAALRIDPSSQVLVFSKTSLQHHVISRDTPRAIYFNDDTYVAWVQKADLLEIATMDAERGAVFYTLANRPDVPVKVQREMSRCLNCHDTFSLSGGGIPRFLFLSSDGRRTSIDTTDQTPMRQRWGGWYVTGDLNQQDHLGISHPEGLGELFATAPYLAEKSDVVALLVLEHQLFIKNLITRLSFKSRSFIASEGGHPSPATRARIEAMMEQLVRAMLFVDAAALDAPMSGDAGFDRWFEAQGPFDHRGRTLRELDLGTRLFKHPLSYVVYSEAFDALPQALRAFIFHRFTEILRGEDRSPAFDHLSEGERTVLLEILTETKPDFAAQLH
jgi:hypothetical protein